MNARDRACLSHWFPTLRSTGVPVPETRIVTVDVDLPALLEGGFEEADDRARYQMFMAQLRHAAEAIGGLPVFLRTGHLSGKHDWTRTCFLARGEDLAEHVAALVEWSCMVDPLGLPTKVWAVRKLLPLVSTFTAFRGFPVNRERRYFIADGKVRCAHPYWPPGAVEEGEPDAADWRARLALLNEQTPEEVAHLTRESEHVAAAFPPHEAWSLDWALAQDGTWYAIDMAPAEVSYHWPGCPHASRQP